VKVVPSFDGQFYFHKKFTSHALIFCKYYLSLTHALIFIAGKMLQGVPVNRVLRDIHAVGIYLPRSESQLNMITTDQEEKEIEANDVTEEVRDPDEENRKKVEKISQTCLEIWLKSNEMLNNLHYKNISKEVLDGVLVNLASAEKLMQLTDKTC